MNTREERSLVRKINRRLAHEGRVLRKTRGHGWYLELGDYYIMDVPTRALIAKRIDPETLAKRYGIRTSQKPTMMSRASLCRDRMRSDGSP